MALPKFKPYVQDQPLLLPPSLDELIPKDDLVRLVNQALDGLDWNSLVLKVKLEPGGTPPYDPLMMLKVLIYAYTQEMYSCRSIAKSLRQNIHYMWLSGLQRPSFNSVNRFRSFYLMDLLELVFVEVIQGLMESGYLDTEIQYVDGTKVEANANKHKVVYASNVEKWKAAAIRRAREVFAQVEAVNQAEDRVYGGADLPELGEAANPLTSKVIAEVSDRINAQLREQAPSDKKRANKLASQARKLAKEAAQVAKYESQTEKLKGRSNYSKTDPDATVMPMKQSDDFKPGYNLQVSAASGFVSAYTLGNNSNDGTSLRPHLEHQKRLGLPMPSAGVMDAGYGHEQNYVYLEGVGIESFVKYPDWQREHENRRRDTYHKSRFTRREASDTYICPAGRVLEARSCHEEEGVSGYVKRVTVYQCQSCEDCPARALCCQGPGDKTLNVSHKLEAYKAQVRERLEVPAGAALYRQRGHEVETVFGEMKANRKFRRFRMRGLAKNTLDLALLFTAHNLRKLWAKTGAAAAQALRLEQDIALAPCLAA